jgi:hypothetical protein
LLFLLRARETTKINALWDMPHYLIESVKVKEWNIILHHVQYILILSRGLHSNQTTYFTENLITADKHFTGWIILMAARYNSCFEVLKVDLPSPIPPPTHTHTQAEKCTVIQLPCNRQSQYFDYFLKYYYVFVLIWLLTWNKYKIIMFPGIFHLSIFCR